MVTTNTNRRNGHFYVWTDDIYGEWSEPIWVDMKGIDPDLFFDDDPPTGLPGQLGRAGGSVWFSCTNGQCRIDIESGKWIGEPTLRWPGTGGTWAPEAPHLYKINGMYYTLLAEGGTERGHMVTIARSTQIGGPYESCPHNPILSHRSTGAELQCTGHGDLVEDGHGNWWMVFLATRMIGYPAVHLLGRETCLAPVMWTADGWPVVNGGEVVPIDMNRSGLPHQSPGSSVWTDEFDAPFLKLEWNFLRNPDPELWSLTNPAGCLALRCASAGLDALDSPAWVGRRLQHFVTTTQTELQFEPRKEAEEAGLTLFLQHHAHYDLAVTRRDGRRVVIARRTVGTFCVETGALPVPEGPVTLSLKTDKSWIDLGVETPDGSVSVVKGEAKFLSTEVSGSFTGLYVALYAKGADDGSSLNNAARFIRFVYSNEEGS